MSKTIRDLGEKTGSTLKFGSGSGNTVPEVRRRSQKGSENTIASMWTWQKHNQFSDLVKTGACWNRYQVGMFTSSMHSLQIKSWQSKHHQEYTLCKLDMARTITWHARINYNIIGKIANKLTICLDSQSSKSRARLTQARVLHNFKQGHGWIEHYKINKTSLLIILKIGTDH